MERFLKNSVNWANSRGKEMSDTLARMEAVVNKDREADGDRRRTAGVSNDGVTADLS